MTETINLLQTCQQMSDQVDLIEKLYREGERIYGPTPPVKKVTMRFALGALIRKSITNQLRDLLDYHNVSYQLREYSGWFESTYHLEVTFNTWNDILVYVAVIKYLEKNLY